LLDYDPESGVLTWRERRGPKAAAGQRAGNIGGNGYRYIRVDRRQYPEHRIIWLQVYGASPCSHIDHKDGDPQNNRLDNLREASRSQNMANRKIDSRNRSGAKGVWWRASLNRWVVDVRKDGRSRRVGSFQTWEDAAAAYAAAAGVEFGEFARPSVDVSRRPDPATLPKTKKNLPGRPPGPTGSGFRGVSLYRPNGKWHASIMVNRKQYSLGYFVSKDDAVKARRDAERRVASGEMPR